MTAKLNTANFVRTISVLLQVYGISQTPENREAVGALVMAQLPDYWKALDPDMQYKIEQKSNPQSWKNNPTDRDRIVTQFGAPISRLIISYFYYEKALTYEERKLLREFGVAA